MDALYSIVGFVVVTLAMTLYSRKKKNSSWEGALIKKKITEDDETNKITHRLTVKTDAGKKVKFDIDQATYNSVEIGQRFKKDKGSYVPYRI